MYVLRMSPSHKSVLTPLLAVTTTASAVLVGYVILYICTSYVSPSAGRYLERPLTWVVAGK